MKLRELLQIPNLLSLSRIPLGIVAVIGLSQEGPTALIFTVGVVIIAGLSDGLDGALARRQNRVTALGITLDPVADKVFAGLLVLGLIFYRDFPVWMAAAIIGRDLLILGGGIILTTGRHISLPSNLPGKYCFAAIVILLGSYILRFDFGITLMTIITLILLIVSLAAYARVFYLTMRGKIVPAFRDSRWKKTIRTGLVVLVSAVYAVRYFLDVMR